MYKIGDFSRLCRVSVKTLRYYDEIGLLKPDCIDEYTGYRYYEPYKLNRFYMITALKEVGFSLEEISSFFVKETEENLVSLISKKQQELIKQVSETQSKITRLDMLMKNLCQEGDIMNGNVIIKQNDSLRLGTVRGLFKDRSQITEKLDTIRSYLNKNGIKFSNLSVVTNYDTEYCTENLDLEVGVQITGKIPESCFIKEKIVSIPNITASIVCGYSSEEIEKAYASLFKYTHHQRYQITGAFYEYYYDDKTVEIMVPVHKLLEERLIEPKSDNIDIPFENDARAIGKWEVFDCLPTMEHFCLHKKKYTGLKWFSEVYFLPKGESYWTMSWTKGYLITSSGYPKTQLLNKYTIDNVDGQKFMFIEMKSNPYFSYKGLPEIWVLKQTDNLEYTKSDIQVKDRTDYPFISDESVIGKWKSIDFVESINDFDPHKRRWQRDGLFLQSAEFRADGQFIEQINDKTLASPIITWTKGLVLCHYNKTAPAYELRRIDGSDYLFIEWKSGDYVFGKRKPQYYVFRREGCSC